MVTKYKAIKVSGKKIDEHRHIMQEHLGRKLSRDECVHHINGDPRDNRIENLEVVSRSDHSKSHVTSKQMKRIKRLGKRKGEQHTNSSLTRLQVIEIKQRLDAGETWWKIGKSGDYPVSEWAIKKIAHGINWTHV